MKFSIILLLVAFIGLSLAVNDADWENHKKKFSLSINDITENIRRKSIWTKNLNAINAHNLDYEKGVHTYKKGINEFSHLTHEEFIATHTGFSRTKKNGRQVVTTTTKKLTTAKRTTTKKITTTAKRTTTKKITTTVKPITTTLSRNPASVDWRGSIMVGPIKDQGYCGSCWAFSAIAALEGQQSKKNGKYINLSDQQITSCSVSNGGCNGGDPEYAYMDLLKTPTKGVNTLASYPETSATSGATGSCLFNSSAIGSTITGYKTNVNYYTTTGSESWLESAVANVGPIAVCLYVSNNFASYSSGIFQDVTCTTTVLNSMNHCVAVVGYGKDTASGKSYWIVRNQWGTSWGEQGYMRLLKDSGNQICIATEAMYPTVA